MLLAFLTVSTAIGLPRQIAAISASFLFGFNQGIVIATLATTFGCALTFVTTRYWCANWVFTRFPENSKKIQKFLSQNTLIKALIIRLLPLGSNFITNIVAGATRIPFIPYITGSFIGFIPQMILFSFAGSGISLASNDKSLLTLITSALIAGLSLYLLINHLLKRRRLLSS